MNTPETIDASKKPLTEIETKKDTSEGLRPKSEEQPDFSLHLVVDQIEESLKKLKIARKKGH